MGLKGYAVAERQESASPEPVAHAYDLFVVHAADDAQFVRGYLLPALNVPPSRVLLFNDLPLGTVAVSEIDRGVSRSRFTVVVLSPAYLADRWAVFGEQLASHLGARDLRIIPLRLSDCELPLRLEARVSLDFIDRTRWELEAGRLRGLLGATAPAAEQIPCPYPGMRPFDASEASRFFGRDKEIDDLLVRIDRGEREIYVIGPSGSGKSSLVQAGLLHVLDSGSSRLQRSFVVRTMRPGEQPTDRLAQVLEGNLSTPATTLAALVARHPPADRVLVVVDQFEELFTLADVAEQQRFIATLCSLRAEPRCCLVLALRADFFGALMDCALWSDPTSLSRLDIAPLRGSALAEAITRPAARMGVHLDARLCDRIVADAAAEPGALPLVQETLRQLWDKRRHRLLGLAEYAELGDGGSALHVAIARRADATMRALTGTQRTIARRMFLRLMTFGEGRADTRRQQEVQALRSAAEDQAEFSRVLQRLIADRLITIDRAERADQALADLSHESLITRWPALRNWIARRRADEQRRRQLEAKVDDWIAHGRSATSMLDPIGIAEAVQWMQSYAARELGYRTELRSLVVASQDQIDGAQRQRRQEIFRTIVVLAMFSVVATIAVLVARHRQQAAQHDLGMIYQEQGRTLLLAGRRMQALPYLVAARTEAIENPLLRMLFAQASRTMPLVTLTGHKSSVMTASFSADGRRVVTAGDDNTARVWDASTGHQVGPPLAHRGPLSAAAFSSDGTRVVTASEDNTARVWNAATGQQVTPPLIHQDHVYAAAFSPDGTRVVTASSDSTAQIWDASTGRPVTPALEHHGAVRGAAFSPDGTRVVTASADHTARVWDAATGRPLTPPLEHHGQVNSAAFDRTGTHVVTASSDHTAQIWDAATGQPVTPPLEHQGRVNAAAFDEEGTRVVTASDDNTARVWSVRNGLPLTPPLEHRAGVTAAAFDRSGTRVVTASFDKTARIWNASSGLPMTPPLEHQGFVYAAAFDANGTRVVTASFDKTAQIWDAPNTSFVTPPFAHEDSIRAAVFSPDGTRVVTASFDNTARVWDASSGQPVTPPLHHQGTVGVAAFSPDGTRVVTASHDNTARVWDASSGRPVTLPLRHQGAVVAAAFSPDGTRVVTASQDNTAQIWDASWSQRVTPPLEHQDEVNFVAFSPDGTRVVTASADSTARVWEVSTGRPVTPPLEHQGAVFAAAFSPDGTRVATASDDSTARVWEVSTGRQMMLPFEHRGPVHAISFSPDGTRVATASDDRTARIWILSIDTGSLEDWQRLVRCSPFELVDTVLVANPDPVRICSPIATSASAR